MFGIIIHYFWYIYVYIINPMDTWSMWVLPNTTVKPLGRSAFLADAKVPSWSNARPRPCEWPSLWPEMICFDICFVCFYNSNKNNKYGFESVLRMFWGCFLSGSWLIIVFVCICDMVWSALRMSKVQLSAVWVGMVLEMWVFWQKENRIKDDQDWKDPTKRTSVYFYFRKLSLCSYKNAEHLKSG